MSLGFTVVGGEPQYSEATTPPGTPPGTPTYAPHSPPLESLPTSFQLAPPPPLEEGDSRLERSRQLSYNDLPPLPHEIPLTPQRNTSPVPPNAPRKAPQELHPLDEVDGVNTSKKHPKHIAINCSEGITEAQRERLTILRNAPSLYVVFVFNRREAQLRNNNMPPLTPLKNPKTITSARVIDETKAQPHHVAISINGPGLTQEQWNAINFLRNDPKIQTALVYDRREAILRNKNMPRLKKHHSRPHPHHSPASTGGAATGGAAA